MEFSDQVVLVTGAGKGLGRAIAQAFAAQGAVVAANDLTPVNLDVTLQEIHSRGGRAQEYLFDIAKRLPAQALVSQVLEDWHHIDILINNAAVAPHSPVLEMDEWDWQRTLDVNLSGTFYLMQAVGRAMRRQGGGAMVNLAASAAYLRKEGNLAAFSASKMGVIGLTRAAAGEFASYNIRMNAVCPGETQWPSHADAHPVTAPSGQPGQGGLTLGQTALPRDVCGLVLFLCSQAASTITGQVFELGDEAPND